eukprot:COSAG06_NODE_53401_length_300_cov_0.810945_1_plen_87_part_01
MMESIAGRARRLMSTGALVCGLLCLSRGHVRAQETEGNNLCEDWSAKWRTPCECHLPCSHSHSSDSDSRRVLPVACTPPLSDQHSRI